MSAAAWSEHGQGGTAVVLLHGIGGGQAIWLDQASGTARALAGAGYRAVALDFPGYGQASGVPPQDMDALVQSVLDVLGTLQAPRVVLLGHSMGGMVAQALAARAPQAVQGLVLACTSAAFGKADGAWQAQFIRERLAPLEAGLGMAGLADALVPGLVSPQAPAAARRVAREVMAAVPEATYRAVLSAIAGFDGRAALADIAVPTLLLAAEHDRTAPPEVMRRMGERMARAEFCCLAGAGHIANVEAPEAFHAAVLGFLRRQFPNDQETR